MKEPEKALEDRSRPLTEDERAEYIEIGELYRHDDQLIYHGASTLLPLSYGSIAIAAQFPALRVALAVFSVSLYLYWLLHSVRLSWYTAVRLERARELERLAGLKLHTWVGVDPPAPYDRQFGRRISIRTLRWVFLIVLLASWAILFIEQAR